ncbi:MAG: HAD family hydrolase [Myxococcota bacterium]|nr:HAD family hydrolase [Myxococcota bacterium]
MSRLSLWKSSARESLQKLIDRYRDCDAFAVFDADNTLWKGDITESLLVWLEGRGLVSLDSFSEELLPVAPLPDETVYGYYARLCEDWHEVGYLWSAQAFQGLSLASLRAEVIQMLQEVRPLRSSVYKNGKQEEVFVAVPKIYLPQVQLLRELRANGIGVWIVSASLEELVRMIVSDPVFGIGVPPERVVGVNMLLRFSDGSVYPSARDREQGQVGLDYYFSDVRMESVLTHHLLTPATWFQGKVSAIQTWIDPVKRPILAAGDSPNDFFMQFYVNAVQGGIRMRIHRKEKHRTQLKREIQRRQTVKSAHFDPHLGWLEVSFEANDARPCIRL